MTSTALQTSLERPSMEVAGVRIYATRDGDRVTGRVEFPYQCYGRSSVPIDYRSARPSEPRTSVCATPPPYRLFLLKQWEHLCRENPGSTRAEMAERVKVVAKVAGRKCSLRSLEAWSQKYAFNGAYGLCDQYTPRPRKTITLTSELAAQAVQVAAWWAFRIGNVDAIDSKVMHTAAVLCLRASAPACLSSIDRYYSWPCDRRKMPFKSFARWAKYDFDKWLLRAADIHDQATNSTSLAYGDGNFQHPHDAFADHPVPLQDAARLSIDQITALPPPTKTRIRDARDRGTRQAIERGSKPLREDPVVAMLAPLEDSYRVMLMRASFKDRDAVAQAIATLPIWWPLVDLPAGTRERINRVTFIKPSDRRPGDDVKVARAKVQMFLSELKEARRATHDRLPIAL